MILCPTTLKALLREARKNAKISREQFEEYDNYEDMRSADTWDAVVRWLRSKLSAP